MRLRVVPVAVLVVVLLTAGCGGDDAARASPADGAALGITLQLGDPTAGGPIPAVVTVTNQADGSATIARPDISPNFVYFEILTSTGETLPFDGPWLSLRPRGVDDFVELGPGESAEHEFDLGDWYSLGSGAYTVTAEYLYDGSGGDAGADALIVAGVMSAPVELEVR